jgi:transcriptional regulator with XRE-family HTH domain
MPRRANRSRLNTPEKLADKLLEIRLKLNESQNGLLVRLGLEEDFDRGYVSKWERGLLEPPLFVLCAYADAANIFLEVLARDTLDLPLEIPSKVKSIGSKIDSK